MRSLPAGSHGAAGVAGRSPTGRPRRSSAPACGARRRKRVQRVPDRDRHGRAGGVPPRRRSARRPPSARPAAAASRFRSRAESGWACVIAVVATVLPPSRRTGMCVPSLRRSGTSESTIAAGPPSRLPSPWKPLTASAKPGPRSHRQSGASPRWCSSIRSSSPSERSPTWPNGRGAARRRWSGWPPSSASTGSPRCRRRCSTIWPANCARRPSGSASRRPPMPSPTTSRWSSRTSARRCRRWRRTRSPTWSPTWPAPAPGCSSCPATPRRASPSSSPATSPRCATRSP